MAEGPDAGPPVAAAPTGPPATWPAVDPGAAPVGPPTESPSGLALGGAQYPPGPPSQWPAWSPPPPGDVAPFPAPPERQGSRAAAIVVAVVAALVLLVVAVGVLTAGGNDDDDVAFAPSEPSETTVPPPTFDPGSLPSMPSLPIEPGPGVDPQDLARPLAEVLPEIIAFVERTRGHEFRTEPVVEAVDDAEFERRLDETSQEEEQALIDQQAALRALGIIDPDTDLAEATRTLGSGGVLGFYQPSTGELLVKGDVVTPLVQTVIAHELTHALDDQIFDLSRLDVLAEQPDESAFGLLAVVEGTARWVETQFRAQMSPEEQSAIAVEELELGMDQGPLLDLPIPLLVQTQVPYSVGARFVAAIVESGGLDVLDVAVQRPPTTSEQVLQPELFLARQPAVSVPAPAAPGGAEVISDGAFGAIDVRMLEVAADPLGAASALAGELEPVVGFGGGRYVSYISASGDDCITFHVTGDDVAGTATIRQILAGWSTQAGAEVDVDAAGSGIDAVTSCV